MKRAVLATILFLFSSQLFSQVIPAPYVSKSKRKIEQKKYNTLVEIQTFGLDTTNYFSSLLLKNISLFKISNDFNNRLKWIDSFYNKKNAVLLIWRKDTLNKITQRKRTEQSYALSQYKRDREDILSEYKTQKENISKSKYDEYETVYSEWELDNKFRFFPARNRKCAALYYNSRGDQAVESLKNGFLKFDDKGGSIYSELISGYGGPLRVSFGGMIAATNQVKIDSALLNSIPLNKVDSLVNSVDSINKVNNSIQRLIGGGGNAVLTVSTPFIDVHDEENNFKMSAIVFDKLCFDVPSLGNTIEKGSVVNGYGLDINLKYSLASENPFGVFGSFRTTFLNGTGQFYENLGLADYKTLVYSELSAGIYIYQFRIFYNKYWINESTLRNNLDWSIGVSLVPFGK